jgi:peptide/nickel transport system permease protein
MLKYTISRLLQAIPVIIGTTFLTFFMLQVAPGDPITLMMGDHLAPDVVERVRNEMHLDDPWPQRYLIYMWNALHGDFGRSYKIRRDVGVLLANAFPKTLALTFTALFFAWSLGVPAGIVSALRQYSIADHGVMIIALFGVSVPIFWSGLILQLIFGWKLGWLPISGYGTIKHLILPGIVLGWASAAVIARLVRSNLLEVMSSDYIRTARAKGLGASAVILRHALKNSLLSVVTVMAVQIASLLSGAVITESVFGIPGVGRVAVGAIQSRDAPLLQASVILTVLLIVVGNLAADLSYAFLDPRIRRQ